MSKARLPRFMFEWGVESADRIKVIADGFKYPTYTYSDADNTVYVIGSPILGETIDAATAAKRFIADRDRMEWLPSVNGEFLFILIDKKGRKLYIANDRFSSLPVYYATVKNQFLGSVSYSDLWEVLSSRGSVELNSEAFFEFIYFQRLFGVKTYDTLSRFLPGATRLIFDGSGIKLDRYWRPDFTKGKGMTLDKAGKLLAEHVTRSARRKTSDQKRYGLFLSGGIDSRLVLAALETPPVCFTLAASEYNNEFRVASEAASIKGARHILLQKPSGHYSDILTKGSLLGGGMSAFGHAFFLGFDDMVKRSADCVFHGHAFDYLFQGMYLPVHSFSILSKKTHFVWLKKLTRDLEREFISGIPYRLKETDPFRFVKPAYRPRLEEYLIDSICAVTQTVKDSCDTLYDLWDFLIFDNMSRHHTFTNYGSLATYVEERKLAFDNDIIDLYFSIPAKLRVGGRVSGRALRYLDPRLARLRTGNTNVAADSSPLVKTLATGGFWLAKRFKVGHRKFFYPSPEDRTWSTGSAVIRDDVGIRMEVEKLCDAPALQNLTFLDMDAVRRGVRENLDGKSDESKFIFSLMTINRFLER